MVMTNCYCFLINMIVDCGAGFGMKTENKKLNIFQFCVGLLSSTVLCLIPILIVFDVAPSGHQGWNYLPHMLLAFANAIIMPAIVGIIWGFAKKPYESIGAFSIYLCYIPLLVIPRFL